MGLPATPLPRSRNINEIKANLLRPALTSYYELFLPIPSLNTDFATLLSKSLGDIPYSLIQEKIQLSCCEATLPGSSLATHEINNDYTGVTERHAYRRLYDDRIDLTFYVDVDYTVIKFFEFWIKFISAESVSQTDNGPAGLMEPNYFYRFKYPSDYQTNFSITKTERDIGNRLTYSFFKAYPINILSMPISYESSSLLKCTVSFTYSRFIVHELSGATGVIANQNSTGNTGGVPTQTAQSSGNSVQTYEGEEIIDAVNANNRPVESGLPYTGRNVGPIAPFSGV